MIASVFVFCIRFHCLRTQRRFCVRIGRGLMLAVKQGEHLRHRAHAPHPRPTRTYSRSTRRTGVTVPRRHRRGTINRGEVLGRGSSSRPPDVDKAPQFKAKANSPRVAGAVGGVGLEGPVRDQARRRRREAIAKPPRLNRPSIAVAGSGTGSVTGPCEKRCSNSKSAALSGNSF